MATSTAARYQHLEPRPGSHYREPFLKDRRIRAAVVHEAVHGPDPSTPEEFARSKFGLLPASGLLPSKLAKINRNRFYQTKQPAELRL